MGRYANYRSLSESASPPPMAGPSHAPSEPSGSGFINPRHLDASQRVTHVTPTKKTPYTHPITSFDTPSTPVSPGKPPVAAAVAVPAPPKASPSRAKKLALLATFDRSPFPGFLRPTIEECQMVHDLLTSSHGLRVPPKVLVDDPNGRAGCGEVPNVLDALVRTVLSQSTTSANSTKAKRAMDEVYGRANYRAVLQGGMAMLQKTIECGGLGNLKGKTIHRLLERLDEMEEGKGSLSLDYLHRLSDKEAMAELITFDGVGIKTASCVLLFCLKRPSFAVDTHVFRISKSLGWIPEHATPDTAFQHLDLVIPTSLKYGLHSLFVSHGRGCKDCASNGNVTMDLVDSCSIEGVVKRAVKKNKKGKGKMVLVVGGNEEAAAEEESLRKGIDARHRRAKRRFVGVVIPVMSKSKRQRMALELSAPLDVQLEVKDETAEESPAWDSEEEEDGGLDPSEVEDLAKKTVDAAVEELMSLSPSPPPPPPRVKRVPYVYREEPVMMHGMEV